MLLRLGQCDRCAAVQVAEVGDHEGVARSGWELLHDPDDVEVDRAEATAAMVEHAQPQQVAEAERIVGDRLLRDEDAVAGGAEPCERGKRGLERGAGGRFEAFLYRLCGIDPRQEMSWTQYAIAMLLFNVLGAIVIYGLQRLQLFLPLNPQRFAGVSPDSSFNTAISFITNTNGSNSSC